ncbi:DUF302 domain-containing protein [Roseivirga sp.]|uniref:DUF302 domain-containing protein n=1 Tax=Roseivirga sp. TaxID=1964215 RepID=UPI003B522014
MNTISHHFSGIEQEQLEEQLISRFKEIGFGVLHQIDFQQTLLNKIQKDIGTYKQLQICNPNLAYEAIKLEPSIGIQLPCNVVVRKEGEGFTVDIQSPFDSIPESSPQALKELASELDQKIKKLLESVS